MTPDIPARPNYNLVVSERQAQLVENAMDLYARLLLGDTGVIEILSSAGYIRHKHRGRDHDLEEISRACEELKRVMTGHDEGESFGLFNAKVHDSARVAWDVAKVVRHRLAWDRNPTCRAALQDVEVWFRHLKVGLEKIFLQIA
jgi:hypothetical protein